MTAREVLDGIKGQLSAITPGVWKVWGMAVMADPVGNSNVDDAHMIAVTSDPHRGLRTFNADFIASAPSTVARLTAALEAVLTVHKPARRDHTSYNANGTLLTYTVTEDGPCVTCYPAHVTRHCEECEDYDDTCEGVEGMASHPWPCPTVAAIENALTKESQ